MAPKMHIDTSRWAAKLLSVQREFTDGLETAVKKGSDVLVKETVKNVSGELHQYGTPSPSPGELPVSRITSMLKQSITRVMVGKDAAVIYPDETKAPYAKYVHDGTRVMKPRRYLSEAIRAKKEEIIDTIKDEVISRIRRHGLS